VSAVAVLYPAGNSQPETFEPQPQPSVAQPLPSDTPPSRHPPDEKPVALFIGDSYTVGVGIPERARSAEGLPNLISAAMGWKAINAGFGGTGYTVRGPEAGGDTYLERLDKIGDVDPAIVVVSGGRNDIVLRKTKFSTRSFYAALRRQFPDAHIFGVQPFFDDRPYSARLAGLGRDVEASLRSIGGTYISGTSDVLTGHREWITADGIHPNAEGYARLAKAVVARLRDVDIRYGDDSHGPTTLSVDPSSARQN